MSDNTAMVILMFIFFGWIPILALGKAISWCIKANNCNKYDYKKKSEDK